MGWWNHGCQVPGAHQAEGEGYCPRSSQAYAGLNTSIFACIQFAWNKACLVLCSWGFGVAAHSFINKMQLTDSDNEKQLQAKNTSCSVSPSFSAAIAMCACVPRLRYDLDVWRPFRFAGSFRKPDSISMICCCPVEISESRYSTAWFCISNFSANPTIFCCNS
mmetsp:Transcript_18290/g.28461  ORF Transcript_18290/g.28461 Transcript_18290/m.28461 type:complete len:163 (+) Transcript_18290:690-1178(+)